MIVSFLFVQSLNEINHFPKRLWQKNEVWSQGMQLNIVPKKKTQNKNRQEPLSYARVKLPNLKKSDLGWK